MVLALTLRNHGLAVMPRRRLLSSRESRIYSEEWGALPKQRRGTENNQFRRVQVERKKEGVAFKAPLGAVGNTNEAWDAADLHSIRRKLSGFDMPRARSLIPRGRQMPSHQNSYTRTQI